MIAVCLKWVDLRPEVDDLTGAVRPSERTAGLSDADKAALEWALRAGEAWGEEVLAVSAGPAGAEAVLREALAVGATRAERIEANPHRRSDAVADALLACVSTARLIVCGDVSADRGSGSVPAFLATRLGVPQALGLVEVELGSPGVVTATRRLDGGRRERVRVTGPAVISVEGSTARLRRSPLASTLAARRAPVAVRTIAASGSPTLHAAATGHGETPLLVAPYRPRARALPAPAGTTALQRVVQLTDALTDREPPQVLELEPPEAADRILNALRTWGELD